MSWLGSSTVQREPVVSKSVRSIGYDPTEQVLEVEWATGKVYRYFDVAPSVLAWLQRAKSKGAFLNRLVKDHYRYQEVYAEDPDALDLLSALQASLKEKSRDGAG